MVKLNGLEINNKLKYKDIVICLFVFEYPYKTLRQLSFLTGINYSRLSESLKLLVDEGYLTKTETYPQTYMKND